MTDRLKLWEDNRDVAMLALAQLLDEAEELRHEPMVVVADRSDLLGRSTAMALSRAIDIRNDIDAIVIEVPPELSVMIVPVFMVRAMTKLTSPICEKALQDPCPEGAMWAVVISGEGMILLHVPVAPLRSIGSA